MPLLRRTCDKQAVALAIQGTTTEDAIAKQAEIPKVSQESADFRKKGGLVESCEKPITQSGDSKVSRNQVKRASKLFSANAEGKWVPPSNLVDAIIMLHEKPDGVVHTLFKGEQTSATNTKQG